MNASWMPVDLWEYQNTTMELRGDLIIVCILCNCQIWIKMEEETLPISIIKQHLTGNHHKQVVRDRIKESSREAVCYCSHHVTEDQDTGDEVVETVSSSNKDLRVPEPKTVIEENKQELEANYKNNVELNEEMRDRPANAKMTLVSSSGSGHISCFSSQIAVKKPLEKIRTSRCLGVFGLSSSTTEEQLEGRFGKFGEIEKLKLLRGFAFVYFLSAEDATKAKECMYGVVMNGNKIRVDYSVPRIFGSRYQGDAQNRCRRRRNYGYSSKSRSRGYES